MPVVSFRGELLYKSNFSPVARNDLTRRIILIVHVFVNWKRNAGSNLDLPFIILP